MMTRSTGARTIRWDVIIRFRDFAFYRGFGANIPSCAAGVNPPSVDEKVEALLLSVYSVLTPRRTSCEPGRYPAPALTPAESPTALTAACLICLSYLATAARNSDRTSSVV